MSIRADAAAKAEEQITGLSEQLETALANEQTLNSNYEAKVSAQVADATKSVKRITELSEKLEAAKTEIRSVRSRHNTEVSIRGQESGVRLGATEAAKRDVERKYTMAIVDLAEAKGQNLDLTKKLEAVVADKQESEIKHQREISARAVDMAEMRGQLSVLKEDKESMKQELEITHMSILEMSNELCRREAESSDLKAQPRVLPCNHAVTASSSTADPRPVEISGNAQDLQSVNGDIQTTLATLSTLPQSIATFLTPELREQLYLAWEHDSAIHSSYVEASSGRHFSQYP